MAAGTAAAGTWAVTSIAYGGGWPSRIWGDREARWSASHASAKGWGGSWSRQVSLLWGWVMDAPLQSGPWPQI